ncbi:hypothetical protein ABMA27_001989 [Loxostege sticticalis]|uniref:BTB domain-containing protein n=1 Tax=Loxostege sticticalis TaxID=481309 RepID=A0ABR3HW69_LOXSC
MSTTQFRVSCATYKANICNGLTSLQQHEQFVDMTLAADGHFVKVHQIVISLASPYLKELILSAPCPHPVVFLNKISYPILCYILEYIYSGEVMVNHERLSELIAAGKELHIKGLQDMDSPYDNVLEKERIEQKNLSLSDQLQKIKSQTTIKVDLTAPDQSFTPHERSFDENMDDPFADVREENNYSDDDVKTGLQYSQPKLNQSTGDLTVANLPISSANTNVSDLNSKTVQYTLTNKGHLQLILNRFLYHLNYSYKNSHLRSWRCVDAKVNKCRASVTTKNDIVVRRAHAHAHGFHDKKIMKKIQNSTIFTTVKDAESRELKEKKKLQNS